VYQDVSRPKTAAKETLSHQSTQNQQRENSNRSSGGNQKRGEKMVGISVEAEENLRREDKITDNLTTPLEPKGQVMIHVESIITIQPCHKSELNVQSLMDSNWSTNEESPSC